MSKRVFSLLLALFLLLSQLPVRTDASDVFEEVPEETVAVEELFSETVEVTAETVLATEEHQSHGVCGAAGCADHEDLTWTAWDSETSLPSVTGNYYLTKGVKVSSQTAVTGADIKLCLNGQTITLTGANNRIYNLSGGAKLTITDCAATPGKLTSTDGLLATWGGAAIYMKDAATVLNLYRGQITGFTANGDQAYGAAVYMGGGTFNMYGGEITNNTSRSTNTSKKEGYAGAVYVNGRFNLYDGIISGNKAIGDKSSFGGAIFVASGAHAEVSGGQIFNNIAGYGKQTGKGGAFYLYKGSLTVSGTAKIYNNKATGAGGGAVFADNTCTLTVSGGQIYNNLGLRGGAVHSSISTVIISGGKIYGHTQIANSDGSAGTTVVEGGAIYASGAGKVTVSGGEIYQNKAGTGGGVYINGGQLEISGGKLYENQSTNAGGAVRMQSGTGFTLSGGEIYENTAGSLGGGIYSAVAMTMSGGKITSNTANNNGAGLYCGGALTMSGGEISGNNVTSTTGPGGVYGGNTITLSGAVKITGNTQAGTRPYNLRVGNSLVRFGTQGMQTGASVGITCEANAATTMVFSQANDTNYSGFFFSDDDGYQVEYTADKTLKLTALAELTGIKLEDLTLSVGQTGTLTAQLIPAGSAFGTLRWAVSDDTVATVAPSETNPLQAVITPLKEGKVDITVTGKGGISATCTVTIIPPHKHCPCGNTHNEAYTHDAQVWMPWTDGDTLPTQSGNWYLTKPVTVTAAAALPAGAEVKLCLNGFDVTLATGNSRIYDVRNGAKLAITDCTATLTDGMYDAGKLTAKEGVIGTWGGVGIYLHGSGSQVDLYQGIITGLTASGDRAYGAAIYAATGAQLNIYGGEISGNTAQSTNTDRKEACGGGIYVGDATIHVYGGVVSGNTVTSNGTAYGGGICLASKTVMTMTGGTVTGNTAKVGGGIFATGAQATISGVEITDNTATLNGGSGLYAQGGSTISLKDTVVTGNKNTAEAASWCGGIVVPNGATTLTVSGKTVIDNNTVAKGTQEVNLLLQGDDAMLTVGELTEGASIGVASPTVPRFISGEATWYEGVITADQPYRTVTHKDGKYYLGYDTSHKHCACGDAQDLYCNHEIEEWIPWTATDTLPVQSGSYYLVEDVNIPTMGILEAGQEVKLCLNGKTVTITGENGRAYRVSGSLTITDCTAATDEKGVYQSGKITGNVKANSAGSAIWAGDTTSRLYLYEGKITGNTAAGETTYGSVFVQKQGEFTMYGGEISGNKSEGTKTEYGGGVSVVSQGKFTLLGGIIRGNEATNGGGVAITQGSFEMKGGTITGNTAVDGGGVVVRAEGTMAMTAGTISANTADHGGGMIILSKGDLKLSGGSISGNTAKLQGGGIYMADTTSMKQSGGTIRGNTAKQHGGGIYSSGKQTTASFTGGSITSNYAGKEGGGAYFSAGKAYFSGCSVSNNRSVDSGGGITGRAAATVNFSAGSVTGNSSKHGGGMIMMSKAVLNFSGGTVSGNSTQLDGAGLYISREAFFNMNGGVIEKNTAGQHGGGFYATTADVKLNAGEIRENTSTKEGGGAYCSGGTLRLDKTLVHDNTAKGSGGGICVRAFNKFDMTENVRMYGNTADNGGAIIVMSGSVLTMNGGEIYENYAVTSGGGLYISYDSEFIMKDGIIRNNKAEIGGGGAYINSPAAISGGKIHNNSAIGRDGYTGSISGGGITIGGKAGTVTITGGEIFENYTLGLGGAIRNSYGATLRIEGGKIYKNKAVLDGGAIDSVGTLELLGGEIRENNAGRYGGAISGWPSSKLLIQKVQITSNSATINGGAVHIPLGCDGQIEDLSMENNSAGRNGGAIYCEGDLILKDTSITGNTASCGAVYLSDTTSDGESFIASLVKLEGDIVIADNTAKEHPDLYFAGKSVATITSKGLGTSAKIGVDLEEGILTSTLFGSYDYEGGNCSYTVTYGDRSLTEPEYLEVIEPSDPQQQEETPVEEEKSNLIWILGVAGAVLLVLVLILVLALRKKRSK